MLRTGRPQRRRNATVCSRHAYQGVDAVEARAKEGLLERVVVVDLGTNDDPSAVSTFKGYVLGVVRAAGQIHAHGQVLALGSGQDAALRVS